MQHHGQRYGLDNIAVIHIYLCHFLTVINIPLIIVAALIRKLLAFFVWIKVCKSMQQQNIMFILPTTDYMFVDLLSILVGLSKHIRKL